MEQAVREKAAMYTAVIVPFLIDTPFWSRSVHKGLLTREPGYSDSGNRCWLRNLARSNVHLEHIAPRNRMQGRCSL